MEWELTSKVTTVSCVQEKGLFHGNGFALKLISVVSHRGTPFFRTREAAVLGGRDHLLVGDLVPDHSFIRSFIRSFLPPSYHLSTELLIYLLSVVYFCFFICTDPSAYPSFIHPLVYSVTLVAQT